MSDFADELTHLKNTGNWSGGGTPSKANPTYWEGGDIPWVSPKDMKTFEISDSQDKITPQAIAHSPVRLVPAGSILMVVRSGILAHTFPVAIAKTDVTLNQDMKAIIPREGIVPKFLAYQLISQSTEILTNCTKTGTTVSSVETKLLQSLPVWIPDATKQEEIVAELDKQLSRLDETISTLQGIQLKLKQARTSILKAAVEGRLVETEAELSKRQGRSFESGNKLLGRTLEKRELQHHADSSKEQRSRRYKTPINPDPQSVDALKLPQGWTLASVQQASSGDRYSLCIGPFGSNLKVSDYQESGVPLVFVRNIRAESFSLEDATFVTPEKAAELSAHTARPGDIMITKMGDPPGDSAIYPQGLPEAVITADVIKMHVAPTLSTRYILYALRSPLLRRQILFQTKGVAQKKVSLERFEKIAIPLPPFAEQERIAEEVDRRFSVLDQVDTTVNASLRRCGQLRQAVLKRAFGG